MADGVDESVALPVLEPGQRRVLIRGNGVKRSEGSKSKWRPRYFHLVEVGAVDEHVEPGLEFRWGVDEDAMHAGKGKVIQLSELTEVEIGTPADSCKWPYPFAADFNTCFRLSTSKRSFHWAAFPSGKAAAVRAKLSIELLKKNEAEGVRPRLGTIQSLSAAAKSEAGRNAVLKTPGWKQAVTIAGEDPKIKAVADELIDSLQIKRDILGSAGIARQISDQWLIETDWTDHAEIDTALENLWALEDQRGAEVDGAQEPPLKTVPSRRSDWVEVRVFVSSTFADMHAEREILVRHVFPRLRAWAEPRRIRIVECDLRWGVPKGAKNETIFRTCLEEVDRCVLANSQCFFLNMLSERYGWAPAGCDVPETVIQDFGWSPFSSVTTMEILHAAYRNQNPRALFMFRDSTFTAALKDDHVGAFTWQDELAKIALPKLKEKIRARFPPTQVANYSCTIEGYDTSTGVEKVVLGGLDGEFAERVYSFFVDAIGTAYGDAVPEPLSPTASLALPHEELAKQLVHSMVGREALVASVVALVRGDPVAHHGQIEVVGENDVGTSTVGAAAAAALATGADDAPIIFYHDLVVGTSVGGENVSENKSAGDVAAEAVTGDVVLVRRLVAEFSSASEEDDDSSERELKAMVTTFAVTVAPRKVVIFIDGDERLTIDRWQIEGVVVVRMKHVSAARDMTRKGVSEEAAQVVVTPLEVAERRQLVVGLLGRYNKTMDSGQLDALTAKAMSGLPGWLVLACEELRVFGVFETVSEKIAGLADSIEGLLVQILERILEEDDDGHVRRLLAFALLAESGLFEHELRNLLGSAGVAAMAPTPSTTVGGDLDACAVTPASGDTAGTAVPTGGDETVEDSDGTGGDGGELSYLDWAVASTKAQPLLWSDVGRYSVRSRTVRKVVEDRVLRNSKGHLDLSPGTLGFECYKRLVDHFYTICADWTDATEGLQQNVVRRVALELTSAAMSIDDVALLKHVRKSRLLLMGLPHGFLRVSMCRRIRCQGMAFSSTNFGGPQKKKAAAHVAFPEGPGYCGMCSMRRDMSPIWTNDSCCMVCGNQVPRAQIFGMSASTSSNQRIPVGLCHHHEWSAGRSKNCLICGGYGIRTPAAVCRMCSQGSRCCVLNLD
eukprot:m.265782 g.265782  ORF g.265782 m.265782 type:complete len:1124 (+) comp26758_c0_seq1:220-3591(+)